MEIIKGIHQVDGIRGVNCYLVLNSENLVLVDTGMPGSAGKIINYIQKIGKKPTDLKYIILTHADIDHIGSAVELKKISGAKLIIHSSDAEVLSGQRRPRVHRGFFSRLLSFISPLIPVKHVAADIILKENRDIEGLKLIHTPGHTAGSLCVYRPADVLMVGDAVRSDSAGNPRPPMMDLSDEQTRASLNLISSLDFQVLLVGHGAPVRGNAPQKLKEMISRMK
jgi:hydroxyacylglutathione hydrolase